MITAKNYTTEVKNIDWAKVPAALKAERDGIEGIMEFYDDDKDIATTIDLFISKLKPYYKSSSKKKSSSKEKTAKKTNKKFKIGQEVSIKNKHLNEEPVFRRYNKGVITEFRGDDMEFVYVEALQDKSLNIFHQDEIKPFVEENKSNNKKEDQPKQRLSTRQQIAKLPNVKLFMPKHQQSAIMSQNSEELDDVINRLEKELSEIPRKQNDGPIKDAIVKAHYFYGESDWFITEYHKGSNSFFGYVILNGDDQMSEPGYISVDEITKNGKIELDFYWKAKPLQKALEDTSDYFKPKTLPTPKYSKGYKFTDGDEFSIIKREYENGEWNYYVRNINKGVEIWLQEKYISSTKPSAQKSTPKKLTKKSTKKGAKSIAKKVDPKIVDHYDSEFKLIRRFYNAIKKETPVTFRSIQLMYWAFQKAIVSKHVSKDKSTNATLFKEVNSKVVKIYDQVTPNSSAANIEVDAKFMQKLKQYVEKQKINYAVSLLRSYISFQNLKPAKDKVERLLKRFDNAIKNKRVDKTNRLWADFNLAIAEMKAYLKDPKEEIPVEVFHLAMPSRKKCTNRIKCSGLKFDGKLKKGYFFVKGGEVAKALNGPICNNRRKCEGLNSDGTLKKGYVYIPGGAILKVRTSTKKKVQPKKVKQLGTVIVNDAKPMVVSVDEGLSDNLPLAAVPVHAQSKVSEKTETNTEAKKSPSKQVSKVNKKKGVFSSSDLMDLEFDTIELTGDWSKFMQEPARRMNIGIIGKPKNGKTAGSTALANELTKFGSVLYNFVDQGINKSTQKLWTLSGLVSKSNAFAVPTRDLNELDKLCASGDFDYVFIDMINNYIHSTGIKYHEFESRFIKKYENISFILVFESTKSGDFKGEQGWTHIVDQLVFVEDFVMESQGRYGMGHYIVWEEGLKNSNPKKYEEYFGSIIKYPTSVQVD